jgi:hypothetical protein
LLAAFEKFVESLTTHSHISVTKDGAASVSFLANESFALCRLLLRDLASGLPISAITLWHFALSAIEIQYWDHLTGIPTF